MLIWAPATGAGPEDRRIAAFGEGPEMGFFAPARIAPLREATTAMVEVGHTAAAPVQ